MVELKKDKKVAIIILCNNSKRWLNKCIDSVMKTDYTNFVIILVDNASTDGSVDEIEEQYKELIVIRNKKNYGWCKANNIGIKYALQNGADYIYLSNSDVIFFDTKWLKELVLFMQNHREYKITGPLQYSYDNSSELNEWTKYILWNGNRDGHFMWSKYISSENKKHNYTLEDAIDNHFDVIFVQGAAMLIDQSVFNQLGYFDEIYFIFYDEVDFCRRNLRIGNRVALIPSSKVKHYGSGDTSSSLKKHRKRNYFFSRNKYYYILSDYNLSNQIKKDIIKNWIIHDIKQSFIRNSDISDPLQLLHIYIDLIKNNQKCKNKSKRELELERRIISNKLKQQIIVISSNIYKEQNEANTKDNNIIELEIQRKLLDYIKKEFGITNQENLRNKNCFNTDWLTDYIIHYDLWKREI